MVSMGGSFKSHGNCSPVAEYNYWCDPDAAAKVYDAMYQNGRKIHMIGLDVTREIVLTPTILEYMCRINAKEVHLLRRSQSFIWFSLAVGTHRRMCDQWSSCCSIFYWSFDLWRIWILCPDWDRRDITGQSVVDSMNFYRKEPNAKVLTQVDTYRFFEMMLSRVLEVEPESLDILENVL